jgi:N-acetyl-anhydromuramyl-L-alanine amidase AmpD
MENKFIKNAITRFKIIIQISFLCAWSHFTLANTTSEICTNNPTIIQKPIIFDAKRIALTQAYRSTHYGIQSKSITIEPKMIVLHWMVISTLEKSFNFLNNPTLSSTRSDIKKGGALNVSAHFIVDKDGTIYQLMPINWMARHIIGLNNIAIGIENVGGSKDKNDLTEKQIEANADLVCLLKKRYPGIQYLIGHFEYKEFRNTPLWQEKDKSYYTQKNDPGPRFMEEVRKRVNGLGLLSQYSRVN